MTHDAHAELWRRDAHLNRVRRAIRAHAVINKQSISLLSQASIRFMPDRGPASTCWLLQSGVFNLCSVETASLEDAVFLAYRLDLVIGSTNVSSARGVDFERVLWAHFFAQRTNAFRLLNGYSLHREGAATFCLRRMIARENPPRGSLEKILALAEELGAVAPEPPYVGK